MARLQTWWSDGAADSAAATAVRQGKSPWAEMVHLLWSAWVFITPVFTPEGYSARWFVLTLITYPLFVLLYVMSLRAPARTAYRYALAMVALSMAPLSFYASGMNYFVFGCVMLRLHRTRWKVSYLVQLIVLNALFVTYARWIGYPWQALVWLPVMTLVIGIVVNVERSNQEKDVALKLSHDEVRRLAATAERERIGRDLHDLLGHTLSLVALKSELAGKLLARDLEAARREIDEVAHVARDALGQVRRAVSGIRAAGIAAELASAKLLLESDGVAFRYARADLPLPPGVETALAMTVREAVTNIQRHARALHADVAFEAEGGDVLLRIVDDGRGGAIVPGNGLNGMRERIEALGGRLRIDSSSGRGTRIEARLPLAANDDAEGAA